MTAKPPFPDMLRLAILNTMRHKARTWANVVGISVAVAALIFFLSFYRGTYEDVMFSSVIDYMTAHLQIQSSSFDEDDPDSWLSAPSLLADDDGNPAIEPADVGARFLARRLVTPAYAGDGARKAAVLLAGADFDRERIVFRIQGRLKEGDFGGGAVIGAKLARSLGIGLGDEIRLQARGADGAPNLDYWIVSGIFSVGYPSIDRGLVLIPLSEAQEFLGAPGKINKIYLRASDREAGARSAALTRDLVRDSGLTVRPWEEFAKAIVEDARKDSAFYAAFIVILLVLSLSTVAGTMQVTVFERRREIGMMRACGWLRKEIAGLFTMEALTIGLAGAALGCVAGGAASLALQLKPVELNLAMSGLDIPAFAMTCRIAGTDFALACLAGTLTALLAGIAPAMRAARTSILSALSER